MNVWLEILDHEDRIWSKETRVPCLPPVGTDWWSSANVDWDPITVIRIRFIEDVGYVIELDTPTHDIDITDLEGDGWERGCVGYQGIIPMDTGSVT